MRLAVAVVVAVVGRLCQCLVLGEEDWRKRIFDGGLKGSCILLLFGSGWFVSFLNLVWGISAFGRRTVSGYASRSRED